MFTFIPPDTGASADPFSGPVNTPVVSRALLVDGASALTGDYSSATTGAKAGPPSGVSWRVERVRVVIRDQKGFHVDKYGKNVPLTNGLRLVAVRETPSHTTLFDFTADPILTNADWDAMLSEGKIESWRGGQEQWSGFCDLQEFSQGLHLSGDNGDHIEVVLNDDLTNLTGHTVTVEGFVEDSA